MSTGNSIPIRLRHLDEEVDKGLLLTDKVKAPVFSDEVSEFKQYFLDRGHPVESVLEIPNDYSHGKSYYLMIGRRSNA